MRLDKFVNRFIKTKVELGFFPDLDAQSGYYLYEKDTFFYVIKIFKQRYDIISYNVFECIDTNMKIVYFFLYDRKENDRFQIIC